MEFDWNMIALGLLGVLIFALLKGMFWGIKRGAKRTTIRIITLVIFMTAALFITPFVSKAILNADIKVIDGKNLNEYITDMVNEDEGSTLYNAYHLMPEFKGLIEALPLVILNIFVFFALYGTMKSVSWVVYAIVARNAVPKKDEKGKKIKHSKMRGMLMGMISGFVLFFFFMIPVNGALYCLNEIEGYKPAVAATGYSAGDGNIDLGMGDIKSDLTAFNKAIKNSPYGIITTYTGVQTLSNMGLDRLMEVSVKDKDEKSVSLNIKNDMVSSMNLIRDFEAIANLFDGVKDAKDLRVQMKGKYDELKEVVRKVFDIDLLRITLNSNFGEFIETEQLLGDDLLPGASEEQLAIYGKRFTDSVYTAVKRIDADFIRDEIITVIDMMQLLFDTHEDVDGNKYDAYESLVEFMDAIGAKEKDAADITLKAQAFKEAVTKPTFTDEDGEPIDLVTKLFGTFGGLGVFSDILFSDTNADLHRLPIMIQLKISEEDAEVQDFAGVMKNLAGEIVKACDFAGDVVDIADTKDAKDLFAKLGGTGGRNLITNIGGVLEVITNKTTNDEDGDEGGKAGISKIVRALMLDLSIFKTDSTTDESEIETFSEDTDASLEGEINKIIDDILIEVREKLEGDDYIEWSTLLIGWVEDIANGVRDIAQKQLTDALADSELGITIDLGDGDALELIQTIVDAIESFEGIINKVGEEGFNVADGTELLKLIGGQEDGTEGLGDSALSLLENLGNSTVVIDITDSGLKESLEEALESDSLKDITQEQRDAIEWLFGLKERPVKAEPETAE